MQFLADEPERVHLVNVTTTEDMTVLFNPASLGLKGDVKYGRHSPPGLDHEVLQYTGTGNRQLTGVEFYLDRFFAEAQPSSPDIRDFERFIWSLTVPPAGTGGVADTRPPRVLFVWPNLMTLECVVISVEFRWTVFAIDGSPLVYTAVCTFEEILDARRTSEQLRRGT
jgi:hypothetical protein